MSIEKESFEEWMKRLSERFDHVDKTLERILTVRGFLDGDKLLDNQDICTLLGVTKRTLQRYRQKNLISYYLIKGKAYYKASEVEKMLKKQVK